MGPYEGNHLNKIPVKNIWLLMAYAAEYLYLSEKTKSKFIENPDDLPDLVADLLCKAVEERMRYGLSNGYVHRAADLNRLRGKIDFVRTYSHGLLKQGKIACTFQELSANTLRNRFVRQALVGLMHVVEANTLKKRINSLVLQLSDLGVSNEFVSLQDLSTDRLGRHDSKDKEMIELAKMASSFNLPSEEEGVSPHLSASRNEHWVRKLFEKAVSGFYKHALKGEGVLVRTGSVFQWPVTIKTEGLSDVLPSMKADIILESSNARLIIDTKFNQIYTSGWMREKTLRSGYLYQIYAYLRTQEDESDFRSLNSCGLLLHPSVGEDVFEQVLMQGHLLSFATIDLTGSVNQIKDHLRDIYIKSHFIQQETADREPSHRQTPHIQVKPSNRF